MWQMSVAINGRDSWVSLQKVKYPAFMLEEGTSDTLSDSRFLESDYFSRANIDCLEDVTLLV
jgi:hypothetical protein